MSSTDPWPLTFNDDPWVQEVIRMRVLHEKQKADLAAKHEQERIRADREQARTYVTKYGEWLEWHDKASDPVRDIQEMQRKIYSNYKYTPTSEMTRQLEAFLERHPEKRAELGL